MRFRTLLALLLVFGLLAAACGDDDDTEAGADDDTTADDDATDDDDTAGACDTLPTKTEGVLTVATGEPAFLPWVGDDNPEGGEGFEAALVYALAEELGVDDVEWVRTGFDEAVTAGEKDYDFNIQQYSITAARDEVVDFSDGYYTTEQAIIGPADSGIAGATTLADLADYQLGAAIGTTSLIYIDDAIKPDSDAAVYDTYADAKAAFDAGQLDGIVADGPTAFYITAVEIPEATIVGALEEVGSAPEELGLLFEDGNSLVPCVNAAIAELKSEGKFDEFAEEWLAGIGDYKTIGS